MGTLRQVPREALHWRRGHDSRPCGEDAGPGGGQVTGTDTGWRAVVYTLRRVDGDSVQVTLPEFLATCGELYPGELDAIRLLAPGEGYRSGGGASPEWSVTREMDE